MGFVNSLKTIGAVTLEDGCQTLPQNVLLHEIFEDLLAVERDDGDTLEIRSVEGVIGGDVELAQLKGDVGGDTSERVAGVDAEVTVGLGIEG
jgi:hypothetical protein